MKEIFVDTWYFIALTHKRDVSHKSAKEIASSLGSTLLVTSEGVLTEFLNFFSGHGEQIRRAAVCTVKLLQSSKQLEIIQQNHEFFVKSLMLYQNRTDKNYSLTDCFSMKIMEERGISSVLTNDDGFRQEGYDKINKPTDLRST
jgi:predicted nucleic acid-binding protein